MARTIRFDDTCEAFGKLAPIAVEEHFNPGYPVNKDSCNDALGISISQYANGSGKKICDIFLAALEDANYHRLGREIEELMRGLGVEE